MGTAFKSFNFGAAIEKLRNVESLSSAEFKFQISLVFICVCLGSLAMNELTLVIWFIVHYGFVFLERKAAYGRVFQDPCLSFFVIIGLSLAVGLTYAWLPVYLWYFGGDAFKFAAMALLVGSTLNTFLVRSGLWYQALCFVIPNGIAFIVMSGEVYSSEGLGLSFLTSVVISICVLIYFLVAIFEAYRSHSQYEMTREQLLQSQKMEAIGSFTGGVAHDFNNILNIVSANLELLRERCGNPNDLRSINQSLDAVDRGAVLIQQMLAFARKSHLSPKILSVRAFISEAEEMIARLLPERIKLEVSIDDDSRTILVDPNNLLTAVLNLVSNGRDAMPKGGVLTISSRYHAGLSKIQAERDALENEEGFICIEVSDSGVGMRQSTVIRSMEPFFTTKPVGKGSGLGLAMVVGFAQQSNGWFEIESELDIGTRARIYFPVNSVGPSEVSLEKETKLIGPDELSTILLVEDEKELLDVMTRGLERMGFQVKGVNSGDAGAELLISGLRPDVIISDSVMPGNIQGTDLLSLSSSISPTSKRILMSGYELGRKEEKNSQELAILFLQKPVSLSDLGRALLQKSDSEGFRR